MSRNKVDSTNSFEHSMVSHRSVPSAKFSIPPLPADLVRRPRLLDFLHSHVQLKLILIMAAAGYGKSSLLIDFAHDTDYPVAYCHLDETDSDLSVLVTSLVASLRQAFPKFQSAVPALAAQSDLKTRSLASMLVREIRNALDEYFVFILDDFHLIDESAPIIQFFDELLSTLPEPVHLLIAGRTIPPLRLASLAAHQQIAGLSEEHLRFTPSEVQELLQLRNHLSLPDSEAEQLVAHSEGWITGILLTTHLMWQGLMAGWIQAKHSQRPLYNYLVEEVLNQQPASLRRFLLESAVLPEMEPQICDAILGRSDSLAFLQQVEDRRLFISAVGDEFPAFQYHHLFREFLISKLRIENPQRLQEIQARAARWYASHAMPEAAVTLYAQADDLKAAAHVAESHAEAMFKLGRYATLQRWVEQLASVAHETPLLYLYLAKVDTDAGKLNDAEARLDLAAHGFTHHNNQIGHLRVDTQRSLVLYRRGQFGQALALIQSVIPIAQVKSLALMEAAAYRYAGLCQHALKQLAQAETSLRRSESLLSAVQDRYDRALVLADLAMVLRDRGQTAQAARVQYQSLSLWRELAVPGQLAIALNNVGWDLHMLGQYESALATFNEALERARQSGSVRVETAVLTSQANLFADMGDYARAAELYRQVLSQAEQAGDWMSTAQLCRALARLDRWTMNYVGALEWLRRAGVKSGNEHAESFLINVEGLRGMVLVEMGQLREGRAVLEQACVNLEQSNALVDLAQTLLYRGCAEFRAGEPGRAAQSLMRALKLAEQVGYDQMLVSEARSVRDLLEVCSKRPEVGARAAALLARGEFSQLTRLRSAQSQAALSALAVQPVAPMAATLTIHALGQSRVLRTGQEISRSEWGSQRPRELLFFLLDRVPIARDRVLEIFWPDMSMARASANLHQTLYRLRRAVRHEVFTLEEQQFVLIPELDLDYDVARFEQSAHATHALTPGLQRLTAVNAAIELYSGDYLADLLVDWTLERRCELSKLHVRLLREQAGELMALTRYAEAQAALLRALAIEPFDDDLHEQMLNCLAGLDRRHEVVDHFRRYRELLRSELGLDPPVAITALYARLIQ